MSNYKRPCVGGATVFSTVSLARREGTLLVDHIDLLREAVAVTKARRPFEIEAWVVLPDHMHAVWTLPKGDANYSDRWGAIKARFSKFVRLREGITVGHRPTLQNGRRVGFQPTETQSMRDARSPSKTAKQDAGIWQRRFWEHHIRDQRDLEAHIRYCWINPVKHGLCEAPTDWPFSSIHRDARLGRVDPEYIGNVPEGAYGG